MRYQYLRRECGSVRIGAGVCVVVVQQDNRRLHVTLALE